MFALTEGCIVADAGAPHKPQFYNAKYYENSRLQKGQGCSDWGQNCTGCLGLRYQLLHARELSYKIRDKCTSAHFSLLVTIIVSMVVVLSGTSVPKPPKTTAEHADDSESRRRGALTRRPVNGSRYRTVNQKLAVWHTYSGFILLLCTIFFLTGTFQAMESAFMTMYVKAPTDWARAACQGVCTCVGGNTPSHPPALAPSQCPLPPTCKEGRVCWRDPTSGVAH